MSDIYRMFLEQLEKTNKFTQNSETTSEDNTHEEHENKVAGTTLR